MKKLLRLFRRNCVWNLFILFLFFLVPITLFSCSPNTVSYSNSVSTIVNPKSKNFIIVIGDGMGFSHLNSGRLLSDKDFSFIDWFSSSSNTDSYGTTNDNPIHTTDSAASATAISSGTLTVNGYIGKDRNGNDVSNIMDYAKLLGKSTGVITTEKAYGATPASFTSHSLDRNNKSEIVSQMPECNVDVIIGNRSSTILGYKNKFEDNGYTVKEAIEDTNLDEIDKLVYQPNFTDPTDFNVIQNLIDVSIEVLNNNDNGFCLMIEQAYIDKYSHNNNFERMVDAVFSLNKIIEYLLSISNEDTTIIVTADHETGSLNVSNDEDKYPSKCVRNNKTISYSWGGTGHSKTPVPIFINKEYDFSKLNYYNSSSLIKNSDVYTIAKDFLQTM